MTFSEVKYLKKKSLGIFYTDALLLPRPLSNDPWFIGYIYRYSQASKRFVEVCYTSVG